MFGHGLIAQWPEQKTNDPKSLGFKSKYGEKCEKYIFRILSQNPDLEPMRSESKYLQ